MMGLFITGRPEQQPTPRAFPMDAKAPVMADVFSWQHLNYTVPVAGGTRQLLNDVSGYVAPGKLTALVGSSGAGKVCIYVFSSPAKR